MKNNKKHLLPTGFADVLPGDAARETATVAAILGVCEAWGYTQVKAPLIEFESSLLHGQGERLSTQTFRLMDPDSREMMALRADMTSQIARIAAQRLETETRPLRLSYAGQVCRVQGEGLRRERQLAQAGIELIGADTIAADVEAISVAIAALEAAGVTDITVDCALPKLSGWIMDDAGLSPAQQDTLLALIDSKDITAIEKSDPTTGPVLAALVSASGPASDALSAMQKLSLPEQGKAALARLTTLCEMLETANLPARLTIDPLERRGFEYHSGISFALFSKNGEEELARGGRYTTPLSDEPAVGATLSVNAVLRSQQPRAEKPRIYAPLGTSVEQKQQLQQEGYVVISGLEETPDPAAEATRLACTHLYTGSVEKL